MAMEGSGKLKLTLTDGLKFDQTHTLEP